MLQTKDLFDFSHSIAGPYLMGFSYPWQALAGIKQLILDLGNSWAVTIPRFPPPFGSIKRPPSPPPPT